MPDNVAPPPHIIRKDALFECYLKPGEKNDPHLGHWTQCKTITHVIDNGREIQLNTSTECRIAGMCLNGRLLEVQDIAIADMWWLCGEGKLRATLPVGWSGPCARTMLVQPF